MTYPHFRKPPYVPPWSMVLGHSHRHTAFWAVQQQSHRVILRSHRVQSLTRDWQVSNVSSHDHPIQIPSEYLKNWLVNEDSPIGLLKSPT